LKYQQQNLRKDLNGLRFISIIAVILYHSKISFFNSGFIGVDIFFVLSGFFITQILLNQKKSNNLNIFLFLNKRFRRILPALIFVMIISSLVIYFFLYEPEHTKVTKDSLLYSSIFFSNYYFYQYFGDYFVRSSDYITLFHTWSLSIEIQFYIFFAFFYLTIFKIKILFKNIKLIILIFLIFSLVCTQMGANFSLNFPFIEEKQSLYFFNQPWWASFYFPLSRLWQFLFGSYAALILFKDDFIIKKNYSYISLIGIFLIILSFFILNKINTHPSLLTLVPVLGTYMIIVYNNNNSILSKFIGSSFFNKGGILSYSAYLIHYPLFVIFKINFPNQFNIILVPLILITFLFSFFSWKFIENPFRDFKKVNNTKFLLSLIISYLIIFFIINIFQNFKHTKLNNYDNIYEKFNLNLENQINERKEYFENNSYRVKFNKDYIDKSKINFENDKKLNVLVIGNSHGEDFFSLLDQNRDLFDNIETRFIRVQLSVFLSEGKDAEKLEYILNDELFRRADIIIISTNFRVYGNYSKDFLALDNINSITTLNKKKLLLTSNSPFFRNYRSPVLDIVFRHPKIKLSEKKINKELFNLIDKNKLEFNKKLKAFSKKNNIEFINKIDFLCDIKNETCDAFDKNGNITIMDSYHYTLQGAKFFGQKLYDKNMINF
tara:strand:- start:710 stop:2695 length:1986 start_codon:yes stop_codon:yes gene_type:complete